LHGCLLTWDAWSYDFQRIQLKDAGKSGCDVCQGRRFPMLNGETGAAATILCGRNAVMLRAVGHAQIALEGLEQRLRQFGAVMRNEYLVRAEIEGLEMVLFSDGRCIVQGTDDMALARSLYARYVGH
jgi:adenylyltransferase/sulfurtransferase